MNMQEEKIASTSLYFTFVRKTCCNLLGSRMDASCDRYVPNLLDMLAVGSIRTSILRHLLEDAERSRLRQTCRELRQQVNMVVSNRSRDVLVWDAERILCVCHCCAAG
jgi:hypothetical protein